MKNPATQPIRVLFAILVLSGVSVLAATGVAWSGALGRVQTCALIMVPLAVAFFVLFRRVQSEDRIARLEVALCREQSARTEADHALAEADLLLARLTTRARGTMDDPAGQVVVIHAELSQLQRQLAAEQPHAALRLELLCRRVERVAASLRHLPRAAEPG
jgi:hypothetical protein